MLKPVDVSTKNRLRVAEYLNTLDSRDFHMHYCTHCIAGHINQKFLGRMNLTSENWQETKAAAARFLDLNERDSDALFEPGRPVHSKFYSPEPGDAAKVMRHLAATDEVDWTLTARPPLR